MQATGTRNESFPEKTALTIVAFAVLLAALPNLPGKKLAGLQPLQFISMLHLQRDFPGASATATNVAKVVAVQPQTGVQAKAPARSAEPQGPLSYLNAPPGSLTTFFAALQRVEQRQPGAIVRVLHYGDSPTSQDYITADVRALLDKRFGDAATDSY